MSNRNYKKLTVHIFKDREENRYAYHPKAGNWWKLDKQELIYKPCDAPKQTVLMIGSSTFTHTPKNNLYHHVEGEKGERPQ